MEKIKVFYGVNGEGLGHISRALSVIEHLENKYEFHIFTYGKAYDFMANQQYSFLHKIEGMMFSYEKGKVDYFRTTKNAVRFLLTNNNKSYIVSKAKELNPSLFISDFEPTIPRSAHFLKKQLISIDNQHRFAYDRMFDLPYFLRIYGWTCGSFAKWMVPNPNKTIISTFHHDRIKINNPSVTLTFGLLRKQIEELSIQKEDFVLVYVRDSVCEIILNVLKETKKFKYKIYGANEKFRNKFSAYENFKFCEIGTSFMKDISNSCAVISTAGNQLISEARFLEKPILTIPEPGQHEQSINGFYVNQLKIGRSFYINEISSECVENFLNDFKPNVSKMTNGVHKVVEIINECIGES